MWIKPTAPVIVLMSMMGAFGFVSKLPGNLGWAMLPECSDYAEWKFGKRGDGLLSSSLTYPYFIPPINAFKYNECIYYY